MTFIPMANAEGRYVCTFAGQRLAAVVWAAALLTFRILLSHAKGDQG